MANPIRRVVQLVLDKAAARRTEQQAKQSLSGIDRGLKSLKATALRVGTALAAAFAVQHLVRFGREAVRVAAAAEQSWSRLANTLKNAGVEFSTVETEIREVAGAMQDVTTVGDEEFADVLQSLVSISGDYEESLRNVGVVADLAAEKQIDLMTAAQLVGRAMIGETALLKRYGVVVEEGADAVEVMREQMRGAALTEGATLEGQLGRLRDRWDDFKEAVGNALIAAANGGSILERLNTIVQSMTAFVEDNSDALRNLGNAMLGVVRVGGQLAGFFVRAFRTVNLAIADLVDGFANLMDASAWLWSKLGADQRVEGVREVQQSLRDWAADVRNVTKDYNKLREEVETPIDPFNLPDPSPGEDSIEMSASVDVVTPDGSQVERELTEAQERYNARMRDVMSAWSDHFQEMRTNEVMASVLGEDFNLLEAEAASLESTLMRLADAGLTATDDGFANLARRLSMVRGEMAATQHEASVTAEIAQTAGQLIGAAMGSGLGPLAAGKARQNAILAAEHAVHGFAALLNPLTAATAGGHFTAAAKYTAIAAAWGGLSAATGGAGGSGASIGGAGAQRGLGGPQSEGMQSPDTEVHIHLVGPGFNAVNPEVQRVVYGATQMAQERYGSNTKVNIHKGSGR